MRSLPAASVILLALVLCVAAFTSDVWAQTTPPQKISQLAGGFDRTLSSNSLLGYAIDEIGDFDNDGIVDLVVGMPASDSTRGVSIVLLNAAGTVKTQFAITASDALCEGCGFGRSGNFDLLGRAVAGIGDLDQDGVIDLVVGAPADTPADLQSPGAVYLLFLNADGTVKESKKITMQEINVDLARPGAFFGHALTSPGDINGDGVQDLVIGAPDESSASTGSIFALFMNRDGTFSDYVEIAPGLANFQASVSTDAALFGRAVADIGDLDEDGFVDLLVAAPENTAGAPAFILFLNRDGTVKRSVGLEIDGLEPKQSGAQRGWVDIDNLGDLNGDGVSDVVVGEGTFGTFQRGIVWILFLNRDGSIKAQQTLDVSDSSVGIPLASRDFFGTGLAGIGDLNGDGVVDLAVGAPGRDDGGPEKGAVWILFSLPTIGSQVDLVDVNDLTGENPILGEDVLIQAEIFGVANVASAEINFRRGGDPTFFSALMSVEGNNIYSFTIPAFAVSERGIEYYVTTTNIGGAETRAPSSGVVSIPVSVQPGLTVSVPGGGTADQYGLVSIPLSLETKNARGVFEDDLGPYDVSAWRMYALAQDQSLVEINTEEPDIVPGRSYWMLAAESNRVFSSGPGLSARTDTPFPIRLNPGWNLIGSPFAFPVPTLSLSTTGNQMPDLWAFEGAWRSNVDTLLPYTGYALFSDGADTLWVDPDLSPANVGSQTLNLESRTSNLERVAELNMLFGTGTRDAVYADGLKLAAFPNPFAGTINLRYQLEKDVHVTIRIYDVLGRFVATPVDQFQREGEHVLRWDGAKDAGRLASGTYVVELTAGQTTESTFVSSVR